MDDDSSERRPGASLYPWMAEAWRNLGAHERPGLDSDPQIKAWAEAFDIEGFDEDKDPYCALFPRWCFHQTLPREPLPLYPKWSIGWRKFGRPCPIILGAVAVFFRGDPVKQIGHVAFVLEHHKDRLTHQGLIKVLGANQKDSVSVIDMPEYRLIECRWPKTWPLDLGGTQQT